MNKVYSNIFQVLSEYKYCVMRNSEGLPYSNDSNDIDLLVPKNKYEEIVLKLSSILNSFGYTRVERSSFFGIECYTYYSLDIDLDPVKLDYFFDFRGGGLCYLDYESLISYRVQNKHGIYIFESSFEAWLTSLKVLLSGGSLKRKYLENLKRSNIQNFKSKFSFLSLVADDIENIQNDRKPKGNRFAYLREIFFHNILYIGFWKTINNFLKHLKYELSRLGSKNRFLVLSGIDGAGKSSLLDASLANSQTDFKSPRHRFKENHHRPRVIPTLSYLLSTSKKERSKLKEVYENPRSGKTKNIFLSSLSFSYYVIDYILFRLKHLNDFRRDKIVIYDRYYYDFLVDPARSAMKISPKLVSLMYKLFIPKPTMTIYVTVPPEISVARKQELTEDDAKNLQESYIRHAKLWSKYEVIENLDFDASVQAFKNCIILAISEDIKKYIN